MSAEHGAADGLAPGTVVDAATLPLAHEPLPSDQVVAGHPTTGHERLGEISGVEVGIWEHSAGTSTDVEADEVFVVLSGSGTVAFDDPALAPIEITAGSIVRLSAGMRTTWTIRETLRKVYLTP